MASSEGNTWPSEPENQSSVPYLSVKIKPTIKKK